MDMENKWIDNLRKQAADYRRKAPEGLLDDIKREMARRGVAPVKRSTLLLRRIAAVAAVIATGFLLYYNLSSPETSHQPSPIGREENTPTAGLPIGATASKPSATGTTAKRPSATGLAIIEQPQAKTSSIIAALQKAIGSITGHNDNSEVDDPTLADITSTSKADDPEAVVPTHKSNRHSLRSEGLGEASNAQRSTSNVSRSTSNASRSTLNISYSGMGGASGVSGNGFLTNGMTLDDPIYSDKGTVNITKAASEMTTHAHHDMPVKLGISLRYNINDRWGIQTGVNYSYLSSDITRSNNIEEYNTRQKLHYVSVPLSASYSIWKNNKVKVYLSAGAEAAKLVKGKATGSHTVYDHTGSTTNIDDKVSEHRLQYSVNGAAGIELNAADRISIFAEPGVTRYFDNHSGVANIYKDKPTQFTINLGLRISLK